MDGTKSCHYNKLRNLSDGATFGGTAGNDIVTDRGFIKPVLG